MDYLTFWGYVKQNVFWIIPSLTSLFFAIVTTILILCQAKWQKQERIRNNDFLANQNKLQQTQICIDLLEKRLKIHDGILAVLREIQIKSTVENNDLAEFIRITRGVDYLFGSNIQSYRDAIYKTLCSIIQVENELKSTEAKTNQQYRETKQAEKLELLENALDFAFECDEVFLEYFDFRSSNC